HRLHFLSQPAVGSPAAWRLSGLAGRSRQPGCPARLARSGAASIEQLTTALQEAIAGVSPTCLGRIAHRAYASLRFDARREILLYSVIATTRLVAVWTESVVNAITAKYCALPVGRPV